MVAYITGMIVGAVCLVFPLLYLMNLDRCIANILEDNPQANVQAFLAHTQGGLAVGVAIVGAVVMLVSTLMAAYSGLSALRRRKEQARAPEGGAGAQETSTEF